MHDFSFIVVGAGVPSRRFCCEMNAGRSRLKEGGGEGSQSGVTEKRTRHRRGGRGGGQRGRKEWRRAGSKPEE